MTRYRLAYDSIPADGTTLQDVQRILATAREVNGALGVSGYLLYRHDRFVQVLEGKRSAVTALFDKISRDPRHHEVRIIGAEPCDDLLFEGWAMGYLHLREEELKSLGTAKPPGDFEPRQMTLHELTELMAHIARSRQAASEDAA